MGRLFVTSVLAWACGLAASPLFSQTLNGFDLRGALVPLHAVEQGGPPKDGIPAINSPRFVAASQAKLKPEDRVLGVARSGIAKAYPVRILNWHEIVNDRFGAEPVAITYCPLCGSGVAFRGVARNKPRAFGVSGLLYNNDVLLYDRESNSLWSQILGQAISGPLKGDKLEAIPISHTSWGDWRARHANTLVLSESTGFWRDYSRDPYAGYETNPAIWFAVSHKDSRYDTKEMVIGVEIGGHHKAYPFSELARTAGRVKDVVNGRSLEVVYLPQHRTARVLDERGAEIVSLMTYWFAWIAFHPRSEIFTASGASGRR